MKPLVSYIIPCYNQGMYLPDTLKSIEEEGCQEYEILIIDDGSSDQTTVDYLKNLTSSDKLQILQQENSGPSVARNSGIEKARGKYLIFLDSDDLIQKEFVKKAVEKLESNEEIACVYGDLEYFGEKSGFRKQSPINTIQMCMFNTLAVCTVIRRDIVISAGGFDTRLSREGLEDWELWLRLISIGCEFRYLPVPSFKIRVTSVSRTHTSANPNLNNLKAYIQSKHIHFIMKQYEQLYYDNKALKSLPELTLRKLIKGLIRKSGDT